ncbi:hypothetical protein J4424_05145 [Candidatus Woesearchaeota archaeon]|nr:hypothetical protein [Candidatus Woesearchaeota archaeon]HIJ05218.1 hypothetical protein [Nanoarchaeota archaeon]
MVILNKKGMDISLNFIILAVLALIALIIIALFFTGGLTNLFGQTEDVASISSEKIALFTSKCEFYCTTENQNAWDDPDLPEEMKTNSIYDSCEELTDKIFAIHCASEEASQ